MSYDTIKDLSGSALPQRTLLQVDGLAAMDDMGAQTLVHPLDRFPRCTVRVATTTNLSGHQAYTTPTNPTPAPGPGYMGSVIVGVPLTINGVALALHERVLVKNQLTATENGIYQVEQLDGTQCKLIKLATLDAIAQQPTGIHVYVREGTLAGYYHLTSTRVTSGHASLGAEFMRFDIDDWYLPSDGKVTGTAYNNYVNAWKRAQDAAERGGEITFYRQHTYGFDTTVEITKGGVTWRGPNRSRQPDGGGRLFFKAGLGGPGIRTKFGQGSPFQPEYPGGYPTTSGNAWIKIEGLQIHYGGRNTEANDYNALELRLSAHIEECCIDNWPGNGIDLQATVQGGDSTVNVTLTTAASFAGAAIGVIKLQVAGTGTASQPKVFFENAVAIPTGAGTATYAFMNSGAGGPFLAPAGSLTLVPTLPTGLVSATNATAAVPGSYRAGANLTSITRCRIYGCGKWGLYIDGSDTNACVITGVDATNCAQRVLRGSETGIAGTKATCTATLVCDATHGPYPIGSGTVIIRNPIRNLRYKNTGTGVLATNGTLTLTFEALSVGAHFNASLAGQITYLDGSSTAFGPLPTDPYNSGVTLGTGALQSTQPTGGTDMQGGGFYDSSFIGNTYIQCHGATAGYTYMSNQGANIYLGCYEELPHSSAISPPGQVYGGSLVNADDRGGMPGFQGSTSPTVIARGDIVNYCQDHRNTEIRFGLHGSADILTWKHLNTVDPLADPVGYKLTYMPGAAFPWLATRSWAFSRAGSLSQTPLALTGPAHFRSHSLAHCPPGVLISNVRFGGEAVHLGATPVAPPPSSTRNTGSTSRVAGVWMAGDFFTGTALTAGGMMQETEPEFWRAISGTGADGGAVTWRPSRDIRTVTDRAALKSIIANRRADGSLVHVRSDNSLWQFVSSSTASDVTETLVCTPTVGTGRWLRHATSVDLKVAVASSTADAAVLFTCQTGFRLRPLSAHWEIATSFTGGADSSIGLSSSNAKFNTRGDLLGGATGDGAADLTAANGFAGTPGSLINSGKTVLVGGDTVRFDRMKSAFTTGSGFAHVVLQVLA